MLSQGQGGLGEGRGEGRARQTYPVGPDPPAPDGAPGQHEAALHEDEHEHEGAAGVGHHQVARNGSNGPEDADCQVVDQKQQQPAHEEPATSKGLSTN